MMAVSSLMVQPSRRIAKQLAFPLIGASGSLVIFCACKKLHGRILGKIVKQSLKANSRLEAMGDHTVAVLGNGAKMLDRMYHTDPLLRDQIQPSVLLMVTNTKMVKIEISVPRVMISPASS